MPIESFTEDLEELEDDSLMEPTEEEKAFAQLKVNILIIFFLPPTLYLNFQRVLIFRKIIIESKLLSYTSHPTHPPLLCPLKLRDIIYTQICL